MINGLDLFSGIGGMSIALDQWVRPVAYCENDRYCQGVLCSRMSDGTLTHSPIWDDVRTFDASAFLPTLQIDIVYGGFPCQDISVAGTRDGLEGERSGLFFELIRICRGLRPRYIFLENVPAILFRGGPRVISELTKIGYDCRWTIVSAAEVGAAFQGDRWFCLAKASSKRLEGLECYGSSREVQPMPSDQNIYADWSEAFNKYPRTRNELPRPMDQIKALGNAVVPRQAKEAFRRLMGNIVV